MCSQVISNLWFIIIMELKNKLNILDHNITEPENIFHLHIVTNFSSKVISSSASGLSTSSQRRNGTNLKLAERYICHRVPREPWSGRMKLWEPERTRSLLGEGKTNRHRHRDTSHGWKNACKEIPITSLTGTDEGH